MSAEWVECGMSLTDFQCNGEGLRAGMLLDTKEYGGPAERAARNKSEEIMTIDLDRLKALAIAASPLPWSFSADNADFMAAATPTTIIAMIDRVQRAEVEIARMDAWIAAKDAHIAQLEPMAGNHQDPRNFCQVCGKPTPQEGSIHWCSPSGAFLNIEAEYAEARRAFFANDSDETVASTPALSYAAVPTWQERCEAHPEHQSLITSKMVFQRKQFMQEEIDDLRAALSIAASASSLTDEEIIDQIDRPGFAWENMIAAEQSNLIDSIRAIIARVQANPLEERQPIAWLTARFKDGKCIKKEVIFEEMEESLRENLEYHFQLKITPLYKD